MLTFNSATQTRSAKLLRI